jgi:signal transduction histidine kinase
MLFLLYTFVVDVAWTFGKQIKQRLRKARAENVRLRISTVIFDGLRDTLIGNILIFFVVCILTSVFDLLDASVYHTGIVLTRYTFFLLSMAMAFILARSYASSFEATAQLNELLDTTVRQRTSQLEEQVLIAEAASRSKGDFLANMSHEIRTPLNAVIGMTDIGERAEDIERKDYAFMRIKQASQHLLGVINDILDMSKIEAGKLEISEAGFSIRDAVIRVENVMRFRTDEKRQNLIVTVADEVPQAVFGDDLRLAQVMTNLVGNAVKFTPENGTISLQVSLVSQVDNIVTLQFLVIDNGIGLTEEQLPHLFNAFQQADAGTVRKYGGTGLGLALSKQIVELMNGDIWVESEFGKGSTFGFTIKAALSENPVKETAVFAEELKADEFLGKTLMLAEDIEVNREIVHALLEISGLKIIDAVDGQEAVELFAAEPSRFDFILMDVQMPVMDGYQATLNIRALKDPHATEIPIVAMTANVFREDIERSLAAGMDAHLGKPIDLNAVVALLRQYLK